ncbi:hypothetical protein RI129_012422 [Pyrocoelia pectoralis]|uniref:Methyltransferase domain-containing protein n=1 Tax=Pyrocoelia pectoralis TaxID=417401 RepID=A0AAN7UXY6_9COLE
MNRTELYLKRSVVAKRDGEEIINRIRKNVQWMEHSKVLDVGCGPGNVTHDLLLPMLPDSTEIFGIDKSFEVIQYANERYGKKSKMTFRQMDIALDTSALAEYNEYFDYIFSFYCFHFILDARSALKNIYKLLKPGGEFLFTFIVSGNYQELHDRISNTQRWGTYISKYNETFLFLPENQRKDFEDVIGNVGFEVIDIYVEPKEYSFPLAVVPEFAFSHFPYQIPENLKDEFALSIMDTIKEMEFHCIEEGKEYFCCKYEMLFAHIKKPM